MDRKRRWSKRMKRLAVPLHFFGQAQVTLEDATRDGVDLFVARYRLFNAAMQNEYQHFALKSDLAKHNT